MGAVPAVGTTAPTGSLIDNPKGEGGHRFFENELSENRRALVSVTDENTDDIRVYQPDAGDSGRERDGSGRDDERVATRIGVSTPEN
jgi:hypothetical protein